VRSAETGSSRLVAAAIKKSPEYNRIVTPIRAQKIVATVRELESRGLSYAAEREIRKTDTLTSHRSWLSVGVIEIGYQINKYLAHRAQLCPRGCLAPTCHE
jgi:hypothetical protein